MYSLREIYGDDFVIWCRQQYDLSRNYLKHCGKPQDWYDIFLIKEHKHTCNIFRRYINET